MKHSISWSMSAVLLGAFAAAQGLGAKAPFERRLSTGLAVEGDAVRRVELRGRALEHGAVELRETALDGSGEMHVLWSGGVLAPAWRGDLSLARRESGASVIAGTMDGGAFRHVAVWRSFEGTSDASATMVFDAVRELRVNAPARSNAAPLRARDLHDPTVIESRGVLHLVGSARAAIRDGAPASEFVWTAPLPNEFARPAANELWDRGLDGRFVADGVDPRVVTSDAGVIVALRAAKTIPEQKGEAPVHFYRSTDLATWTLDETLSQGIVARSDYSIALDGRALWIATSAGEDGETLAVRRVDGAATEWREVARRDAEPASTTPSRGRLWLIPRSLGGGLDLVRFDARGELQRTEL